MAASRSPVTWPEAPAAYTSDRLQGRRALHALSREDAAQLPPAIVLVLADAQLRSGRRRAAGQLFEDLVARAPGEPWVGWAEIGLGWTALTAGDRERAREVFARVAERESSSRHLAFLLLAMLEAVAGRAGEARERFTRLAGDPTVSPALRRAAQLGIGYSFYWAGEYQAAAETLDAAAVTWDADRLSDDARYAAARARWHAGQHAQALVALRALADEPGRVGSAEHVSRSLLDLEPGALLRAGSARHRRGPLRAPEDQVTALLDCDGRAFARAALRHIAGATEPASTGAPQTARIDKRGRQLLAGRPPSADPAAARTPAPPAWPLSPAGGAVLGLAVLLAVARLAGPCLRHTGRREIRRTPP